LLPFNTPPQAFAFAVFAKLVSNNLSPSELARLKVGVVVGQSIITSINDSNMSRVPGTSRSRAVDSQWRLYSFVSLPLRSDYTNADSITEQQVIRSFQTHLLPLEQHYHSRTNRPFEAVFDIPPLAISVLDNGKLLSITLGLIV
jgi:hypothetical protein